MSKTKQELIHDLWGSGSHNRLLQITLSLAPSDLDKLDHHSLTFLGLSCAVEKKFQAGLGPLRVAAKKAPENIDCQLNFANCLKDAGRFREALDIYDGIPQAKNDELMRLGAGICLNELGEYRNALLALYRAQELNPKNKVTALNIGLSEFQLEQLEASEKSFERALDLDASYAPAAINLSMVRIRLHKYDLGLSLAQQVFESGYRNETYMRTLLSAAMTAGQVGIAKQFYEKYCKNASPRVDFTGSEIYRYLKELKTAVKLAEKVISSQKDFFSAYVILYHSLAELGQISKANRFQKLARKLCDPINCPPEFLPNPWTYFAVHDDPVEQLVVARRYAKSVLDLAPRTKSQTRPASSGQRITIAYMSPDFKTHPVSECMVRVFRAHDREKVKVLALNLSPKLDSYSRLVEEAVDEFHHCQKMSYEEMKRFCIEKGVDILIDLAVHTSTGRPNFAAFGLAPVQINHLGYSGTSGSAGYDLIIADHFIVPPQNDAFYSERVARLDLPLISCGLIDTQHIAAADRASHGVEGFSFVYGCLANPYKMTREVLGAWASILVEVDGSCLLLGSMQSDAFLNIQKILQGMGVKKNQVVQSAFQEKRNDHLSRLKVVDVFLDTIPYNAHSLAADAVSCGVPVVTFPGKSFASRVAGSLNSFLELESLNARSLDEYVRIAVGLSKSADDFRQIKNQIVEKVSGLNWAAAYADQLENVYRQAI